MVNKLNEKVKVLDHGYVQLVEHWGSDERVIEAARMSTDKGFLGWGPMECECVRSREELEAQGHMVLLDCLKCKNTLEVSGDEKLLKYLYEHKHATPFEMAGVVFEIQAPILVFREWHRHRTQCLSGETELYFEMPNRVRRGQKCARRLPLKKMFQMWNKEYLRPRIRRMYLRCLNEETNEIITTHINNIVYSGKKEVYQVLLKDGKKIVCSKEHKFIINGVWSTLEFGLELQKSSDGLISWKKDCCLKVNGRFEKGTVPWNLGRKYKTNYVVTDEHKRKIREATLGSNSNFWKGGMSSERSKISRWTTDQAPKVHKKFNYVCQLCLGSGGRLHCHHVIPVWADESKAYDFENLITLCGRCHVIVSRDELNYVERFCGIQLPLEAMSKKRPSCKGKTRIVSKDVEVKEVIYLGVEDCYDVSVDGPFHNFVANGIITHNSYNEMSGRYIALPDLNYVPTVDRLMMNARVGSKANKQIGTIKGADELTESSAQSYIWDLEEEYKDQERLYQRALKIGVPKELARVHIGVGRYSRMRAQANLRNWLAFLTLRMAPDSQWEIRQYANLVGDHLKELFPRTWELFVEGRKEK